MVNPKVVLKGFKGVPADVLSFGDFAVVRWHEDAPCLGFCADENVEYVVLLRDNDTPEEVCASEVTVIKIASVTIEAKPI